MLHSIPCAKFASYPWYVYCLVYWWNTTQLSRLLVSQERTLMHWPRGSREPYHLIGGFQWGLAFNYKIFCVLFLQTVFTIWGAVSLYSPEFTLGLMLLLDTWYCCIKDYIAALLYSTLQSDVSIKLCKAFLKCVCICFVYSNLGTVVNQQETISSFNFAKSP